MSKQQSLRLQLGVAGPLMSLNSAFFFPSFVCFSSGGAAELRRDTEIMSVAASKNKNIYACWCTLMGHDGPCLSFFKRTPHMGSETGFDMISFSR